MDLQIKAGDIVLSKAGRDKGRYFIVMRCEDIFAYVCDGDLRKADKPKKKKIRHLKHTGESSGYAKDKLDAGEKLTNTELRRAVSDFLEGVQ